mgnify:CR=1 FL=1
MRHPLLDCQKPYDYHMQKICLQISLSAVDS